MTVSRALVRALGAIAFLMAPAAAQAIQCVPFARQASGIEIYGNAHTWWGQAARRYERGNAPREGAVLAMPGHGRMRLGHVAMVSRVLGDREVLLTHANWSRRGGIERNVRAIDVSEKGDWSRVKIWFARNGDLGTTSYPAHGFIYPGAAKPNLREDRAPLIGDDILQMARLEAAGSPAAH